MKIFGMALLYAFLTTLLSLVIGGVLIGFSFTRIIGFSSRFFLFEPLYYLMMALFALFMLFAVWLSIKIATKRLIRRFRIEPSLNKRFAKMSATLVALFFALPQLVFVRNFEELDSFAVGVKIFTIVWSLVYFTLIGISVYKFTLKYSPKLQ